MYIMVLISVVIALILVAINLFKRKIAEEKREFNIDYEKEYICSACRNKFLGKKFTWEFSFAFISAGYNIGHDKEGFKPVAYGLYIKIQSQCPYCSDAIEEREYCLLPFWKKRP